MLINIKEKRKRGRKERRGKQEEIIVKLSKMPSFLTFEFRFIGLLIK